MTEAILFDLDETLYDEFSYVFSGLCHISKCMSERWSLDEHKAMNIMLHDIRENGRGKTFNSALKSLGVKFNKSEIQWLIDEYRGHKPCINLFQDALYVLDHLRSATNRDIHLKLGLVTDGFTQMQRNKVIGLGLEGIFDTVIYCAELNAPKPTHKSFIEAVNRLNVSFDNVIMVGDRIDHDLIPAKQLGMLTYRVRRGIYSSQFTTEPHIDYDEQNLLGLLSIASLTRNLY